MVGLAAQLMGAMGARRFFFNGDSHLQVATVARGESITVIDGQFHDCHGLCDGHSFWIYTVILLSTLATLAAHAKSHRDAPITSRPLRLSRAAGPASRACRATRRPRPTRTAGSSMAGIRTSRGRARCFWPGGTYFRNDRTKNVMISMCFGPGQSTAPARSQPGPVRPDQVDAVPDPHHAGAWGDSLRRRLAHRGVPGLASHGR